MGENINPFEDYYKEASDNTPPKGETAREIIEALEKKANKEKSKEVAATSDAKSLRGSINEFIKKLNSFIGEVFRVEKRKGTRPDMIITLVVGGLAFTLANVYFLLTRNLKSDMSEEDYTETFMGMYKSALKNIRKNKDEGE